MTTPSFHHVQPGQPAKTSPARSARWLNAVSDAAVNYQQSRSLGSPSRSRFPLLTDGQFIKGFASGSAILERGDAASITGYRLDEFDPTKFWFNLSRGVGGPNEDTVIVRKKYQHTEIVAAGGGGSTVGTAGFFCQMYGVTTMRVYIRDATHQYVRGATTGGEASFAGATLESSTAGFAKIILTGLERTPGEIEELPCIFGAGGAGGGGSATGSAQLVLVQAMGAANWDDENQELYVGSGTGLLLKPEVVSQEGQPDLRFYTVEEPIDFEVPFLSVAAASESGIVGIVVGGLLVALDCLEVDQAANENQGEGSP